MISATPSRPRAAAIRVLLPLLAAGCLPSAAGCSNLSYAISAAVGHLNLLSARESIETALLDPTLTDEERAKLALIVRARDYAAETVGLNVGESYQAFVNLHGEPLAWNLSASAKDAFQPYVWRVPFAGNLPYLGYFDYDQVIAERDRLVDAGYDTFIYELDAYSTLGLLPDPVTSAMLARGDVSLADTIMHELSHNTIWRPGDTTFNESMATFIGQTAGLEFILSDSGNGSDLAERARRNYEDQERFNIYLQGLVDELTALYAENLPRDAKLARRDEIFEAARVRLVDEVIPLMSNPESWSAYRELTLNNAFLLANTRYNSDLEIFAAVYESTGRDWAQTLAHFKAAAAAADPYAYLRQIADAP